MLRFGLNLVSSGGANVAGAAMAGVGADLSLDYLRHLVLPVLTLAIYLQVCRCC